MSRYGNFSSSEIYNLMSKTGRNFDLDKPGKPFFTYVKNKQRERRLNRPISQQTNARATNWGTFVESVAFDLLGS